MLCDTLRIAKGKKTRAPMFAQLISGSQYGEDGEDAEDSTLIRKLARFYNDVPPRGSHFRYRLLGGDSNIPWTFSPLASHQKRQRPYIAISALSNGPNWALGSSLNRGLSLSTHRLKARLSHLLSTYVEGDRDEARQVVPAWNIMKDCYNHLSAPVASSCTP